jgi:hypothetical protein
LLNSTSDHKLPVPVRTFVDLGGGTPVTVDLNEAGEVINIHKD